MCLFASLTKETRHMIGARELGLMKQSAYLINIARGELIDQNALGDTLARGTRLPVPGSTYLKSNRSFDSPLFNLDNVVLTPHQAGLTQGGKVGRCRASRAKCAPSP